jgi:hypothetical protein
MAGFLREAGFLFADNQNLIAYSGTAGVKQPALLTEWFAL